MQGHGCVCTVKGCCLKRLYCWSLPTPDWQDIFCGWWSWCHHDGKSSIAMQEDCYSRRPIYKDTCLQFYCYGGGNIFEAIVLLNSPLTGPTAPLYWMMGCLPRNIFCDGYLVVVWLMALVSYLCGAFISGWCCWLSFSLLLPMSLSSSSSTSLPVSLSFRSWMCSLHSSPAHSWWPVERNMKENLGPHGWECQ